MPEPVRPEFLPDPELDREAMEALQRDIADAAEFVDGLPFDPASVDVCGDRDDTVDLDDFGGDATDGDAEAPPAERDQRDGDPAGDPPLVAGVDQAFLDDRAVSAVVVLRGDEVIERTYAVTELSIPYIPGLLAFREGGPIVDALATMESDPDLYVLDGSGRVHFRQAGIATHVGVLFDAPAVGVAKSLLCGTPDDPVDGRPAGWRTPVRADDSVDAPAGTTIGHAYQSRQYDSSPVINPLYVSPGHRVSAGTAVDLVAALCDGYKLPEPTRLADAYADEAKREVADGE
ncbi:endonuclease V [Halobaculum magnesiiphilum]|uniref:Endonuclease V n=1 Tax=Halobaculum magnesiiphilum TaxID=1017351 RepID=A0A8T8WA73_9EURY|nr:endonuclease V [Halobaculum magnesiiphilum]QZP36740.1 endonuclease V [Halobaculum magnesiiphilum]